MISHAVAAFTRQRGAENEKTTTTLVNEIVWGTVVVVGRVGAVGGARVQWHNRFGFFLTRPKVTAVNIIYYLYKQYNTHTTTTTIITTTI